jgi:hypothetical protein
MEPNKPTLSKAWIFIGLVIVVAIIGGIYYLTQKSMVATQTPDNVDVVNKQVDAQPKPSLANDMLPPIEQVTVTAKPTSLSVTNLQTFPYQVQAKIITSLPDNCSTTNGTVTQNGKVFTVTVTASHTQGAMCAQVITSNTTTVDIPVAGLAAGTYTVKYATFSKTFTLAQNNSVGFTSDK